MKLFCWHKFQVVKVSNEQIEKSWSSSGMLSSFSSGKEKEWATYVLLRCACGEMKSQRLLGRFNQFEVGGDIQSVKKLEEHLKSSGL